MIQWVDVDHYTRWHDDLDYCRLQGGFFVVFAITLWFENKNHEVSQNLIVRQSKLDKMTVSQSLKKLVADGYIQRSEHSEDTRMKTVCLTKKGKALASKLVPIVEKVDAKFFDAISKQDQKILLL